MVRPQFPMATPLVMRASAPGSIQSRRLVTGPATTRHDALGPLRGGAPRTQRMASAVFLLVSMTLTACSDGSGRAAGVAGPLVGVAAVRGYSRKTRSG